jgi:hypothetical protein
MHRLGAASAASAVLPDVQLAQAEENESDAMRLSLSE